MHRICGLVRKIVRNVLLCRRVFHSFLKCWFFGWHLFSSSFRLRFSYHMIERVVKTPIVIRTFDNLWNLPFFCAPLSGSVSFVGYTAGNNCWRADGEAVSEFGGPNWGDVVRAALFWRTIRYETRIVFLGSPINQETRKNTLKPPNFWKSP